jgi:hypothetical protein
MRALWCKGIPLRRLVARRSRRWPPETTYRRFIRTQAGPGTAVCFRMDRTSVGVLCRSHIARREAGGPAGAGTDQVRDHPEPQDRQGTWASSARRHKVARRQVDRIGAPSLTRGASRIRKAACTVLCGGRSAMSVPTAPLLGSLRTPLLLGGVEAPAISDAHLRNDCDPKLGVRHGAAYGHPKWESSTDDLARSISLFPASLDQGLL